MKKSGSKRGNLKKVIKNIGVKSVVLSILVFLLTVGATAMGGYQLY